MDAERTRDPKQPKRFEKNKNIDSRRVSQLQDSAQMANRFHGPVPILSWRRNNQPAFIRSKEDETNCHNWSNTFLLIKPLQGTRDVTRRSWWGAGPGLLWFPRGPQYR